MKLTLEQIKDLIANRHKLTPDKIGVKNAKCSIKAQEKGKDRTFTAVITSDRLDRDREVLLPQGMVPTEFMAGKKTIFWNHDYDMPIGAAKTLRQFNDRWESDAFIAKNTEAMADFFPDYVWSLMTQDILGGISVGYQTIEQRRPTVKDYKDYGNDVENIITRWKLLEWSVAPLQANIDGIVTAIQKGLIKPEQIKWVLPDIVLPTKRDWVTNEFFRKGENVDQVGFIKILNISLRRSQGKLYESEE